MSHVENITGAAALGVALREGCPLLSLDLGANTRLGEQGWKALARGLEVRH
jgi:hypothetical protein